MTGLGLGNSVQKNLYLPEAQNDFILAIIGEELGFIGILALVFVYVLLVWRGCHTAMNARDYTGMMLASGITMMVGLQVVINIAVVTSSMPPTGIILPFISYGGNALLIFMGRDGCSAQYIQISGALGNHRSHYESHCNRRRYRGAYLSGARYRG